MEDKKIYAEGMVPRETPRWLSDRNAGFGDRVLSVLGAVEVTEERVTDPDTGGQKGRKEERFDLIPWDSVAAIARVYSFGSKKYSPHNWRRGYAWSLSFAALMRHLTAWWEGEDLDRESGMSHLAHAGFHILSLLWYSIRGMGKDDRPSVQLDRSK